MPQPVAARELERDRAGPKRVKHAPMEAGFEILDGGLSDSGSDWEPDWASGQEQDKAQSSEGVCLQPRPLTVQSLSSFFGRHMHIAITWKHN